MQSPSRRDGFLVAVSRASRLARRHAFGREQPTRKRAVVWWPRNARGAGWRGCGKRHNVSSRPQLTRAANARSAVTFRDFSETDRTRQCTSLRWRCESHETRSGSQQRRPAGACFKTSDRRCDLERSPIGRIRKRRQADRQEPEPTPVSWAGVRTSLGCRRSVSP